MDEIELELSLKQLMKNVFHYVFWVVAVLAFSPGLNASNLTCYDGVNGDPTSLRLGPCANQLSFSNFASQFVDWGVLGSALANTYDPAANSNISWQALSSGGITVGLNRGPGFTGNPTLQRLSLIH